MTIVSVLLIMVVAVGYLGWRLWSARPSGFQHLTVEEGWSNDLQTIVWDEVNQEYVIYFLHSRDGASNPMGPSGQEWVRTTTKDFRSYTAQTVAIASTGGDERLGWRSAWTGSVVVSDGRISGTTAGEWVAFISGLDQESGMQAVWAVASEDGGKTFTRSLNEGIPLVTAASSSQNQIDFRDPFVASWQGAWVMVVAEGDVLGVYQSNDGIQWQATSKVSADQFFSGRTWQGNAPVECPVLKTMRMANGEERLVLFFGAKDASHQETTGTYYTIGHLDDDGRFVAEMETRRLDEGSDYYGANFTGSMVIDEGNDEIITMGWIGNWNYTSKGIHPDEEAQAPYRETVGSYSLARRLTLQEDGSLRQEVIGPLVTQASPTLLTREQPLLTNPSVTAEVPSGLVVLYDRPQQSVKSFYQFQVHTTNQASPLALELSIYQGGDYVQLHYDSERQQYQIRHRAGELDHGLEGETASYYYYDGLLGNGQGYAGSLEQTAVLSQPFRIWTDQHVIEIQFPNGELYTVARFSNLSDQDVKLYSSSGDEVSVMWSEEHY